MLTPVMIIASSDIDVISSEEDEHEMNKNKSGIKYFILGGFSLHYTPKILKINYILNLYAIYFGDPF